MSSIFRELVDPNVPGTFVVLQGVPGDGMINTVDASGEDWEHLCAEQASRDQSAFQSNHNLRQVDTWWLSRGQVVILDSRLQPTGQTLPPGSLVVAEEVVSIDVATRSRTSSNLFQVLRQGDCYIPFRWNGFCFVAPEEILSEHHLWYRVTCPMGAVVRNGLDLSSNHITTLPYGTLVAAQRKTINGMGLSRLKIKAQQVPTVSHEGWCSEFLNPLSGQRGAILQALSFPVPLRYRLIRPAMVRRGIELSSAQSEELPPGSVISVTKHAFTDHPMDRCVPRLQLAGQKGWISVYLNRPNEPLIAKFIGHDSGYDPQQPHYFHRQHRGAAAMPTTAARVSPSIEQRSSTAELSSVDESESGDTSEKEIDRSCLICLTSPRTATIVHGETGHVACCLLCARILMARGDPCPVCRLPMDSIIQHFWA